MIARRFQRLVIQLVLQRRVNCSPRGPRCRMRPPAGRCTLLNKNCSSCSLAHSAPAAAALPAAGLLCLRLGPRLLPTGFAGVQQDQTPDAVPGRQSVGVRQGKGSRPASSRPARPASSFPPPTPASRPWPESSPGESGQIVQKTTFWQIAKFAEIRFSI